MTNIVSLIQNLEDYSSIGAPKPYNVDLTEQKLGIPFASDYKDYVMAFGAASFYGHELTGVCNSERLDVISATERSRHFFSNFPADAYVIEELLFDHIVVIQTQSGLIYSYGPSDKMEKIANNLCDYLFPAE